MIKMGLKVLSLFDGISCGMVALERAGFKVERYVAYEVEKNAIKISQKNYPEIEQCGDVRTADFSQYEGFDLLIGGSPCQDLSNYKYDRGEVKGLNGEKSSLFYYYVKALKEVKPKYFLLENVASMEKKWEDVISEELGVKPIMINSALVCAAERKRLYWTNIPNINQPKDKGIVLKDVVIPTDKVPDKYWYTKYPVTVHDGNVKVKATIHLNSHRQAKEVYGLNYKCNTLLCDGNGGNLVKKIYQDDRVRKLTPLEYERLQTLPDNYTDCVADSRRYTAIGNGWTVDVIAHIFSFMKDSCNREKRDKIIIGTLFKLKSETNTYTILYCGKVGNKYLLYNQNLKTFKLVKSTWVSEHIKRIQFCECNDTKMNTKKDKIEFRKKLAKAKKERYIREHGCNRN